MSNHTIEGGTAFFPPAADRKEAATLRNIVPRTA
jgi:hypothetical protein